MWARYLLIQDEQVAAETEPKKEPLPSTKPKQPQQPKNNKVASSGKTYTAETRRSLESNKQPPKSEKNPKQNRESGEEEADDTTKAEIEAAAVKIQAGFRGYKTRQEMKERQAKETRPEAEDKKTPDTSGTEEAAAIKIQSSFRGYKVRKEMKTSGNSGEELDEVDNRKFTKADETRNTDEEETAAIKIQAGFRGYQVRKEVEAKKNSLSNENSEEARAPSVRSEAKVSLSGQIMWCLFPLPAICPPVCASRALLKTSSFAYNATNTSALVSICSTSLFVPSFCSIPLSNFCVVT